jgi:ubiquinone/menaquinone biosynthesis C-methylase UbiE
MSDYEMQSHWSAVGERVGERQDANMLDGDDSPYYRYKAEQFSSRFLPRIPVDGLSMLDVGCGAGGTLRWMADHHHPKRLVGCDQAPSMVEMAKRNVPSAEVVLSDGDTIPFADQEFDVVTTVTVLHHNPDERRSRLLGEICRVSGGEVLLFEDTSLAMPVPARAQGPYQNFYGRPVGWYAGVCRTHGFDLVETQYLQTKASLRTFLLLWSYLNRDRKGSTEEGSPFSPLHLAIERRTLPITKRLDPYIKSPKGENTMMRFKRAAGPS